MEMSLNTTLQTPQKKNSTTKTVLNCAASAVGGMLTASIVDTYKSRSKIRADLRSRINPWSAQFIANGFRKFAGRLGISLHNLSNAKTIGLCLSAVALVGAGIGLVIDKIKNK